MHVLRICVILNGICSWQLQILISDEEIKMFETTNCISIKNIVGDPIVSKD